MPAESDPVRQPPAKERIAVARFAPLGCFLLCLLLVAKSASAAEDKAAAERSFDALYARAAASYQAQRYAAAAEDLLAAYKLKPEPRLLFNIAQAYRKLGDASQAQLFFRQYLERDQDIPAAKQEQIQRYLDELAAPERAAADKRLPLMLHAATAPSPENRSIASGTSQYHTPRWSKVTGGLMLASGGALVTAGIVFLALDGRCTQDPVPPATECGRVYQTLTPAAALTGSGAGILIAGTLILSVPYLQFIRSQRSH